MSIQLSRSHYREAVARITEEKRRQSEVVDFIRGVLVDSENEAATELLADLQQEFRERDFLKKLKAFYDDLNYIEVRDTGHGMSLGDLTDVFLRIGTHSRRNENLDGARNLGDKGIGRLSTMRLGDHLRVKTSKSGERYWNLLDIDWTRFSDEDDIDADQIDIEPEIGDEKAETEEHGTIVRVSALRGDWDDVRFADILQGRIARMVDPFVPGSANRLIVARHNGKRVQVPSIPEPLLRAAHAVCHVNFRMDGHTPVLTGEIDYRLRHRKRKSTPGAPRYIHSLRNP